MWLCSDLSLLLIILWMFLVHPSLWMKFRMILQINNNNIKTTYVASKHEQHAFKSAMISVMTERQSRQDNYRPCHLRLGFWDSVVTGRALCGSGTRNHTSPSQSEPRLCLALPALCAPHPIALLRLTLKPTQATYPKSSCFSCQVLRPQCTALPGCALFSKRAQVSALLPSPVLLYFLNISVLPFVFPKSVTDT